MHSAIVVPYNLDFTINFAFTSNKIIRLNGLLSIHGKNSSLALWLRDRCVIGAVLGIMLGLPTLKADILTGKESSLVIFPTL